MADPLSVTGSIVGIVSLGLTLCSGFVEYYSAFKHQDKEVQSLPERLSLLTGTLKTAQPRLHSLQSAHPNTTAQVTSCLQTCSRSISKLEKILQECRSAGSRSNAKDKIRAVVQRAHYPFLKETLRSINQEVTETQHHLNMALQVLKLDMLVKLCDDGDVIVTTSTAAAADTRMILNRLATLERNISAASAASTRVITSPTQSSSIADNPGNFRTTPSMPSRFHDVTIGSRNPLVFSCSCQRRINTKSSNFRYRTVTFFRETVGTTLHARGCPYYAPPAVKHRLGATFSLGSFVHGWMASVMWCFSQGVGCFSIAPELSFKAIVPYNSPAFALLRGMYMDQKLCEASEACKRHSIQNVLPQILCLFRTGKASPTDTTQWGQTILFETVELLAHLNIDDIDIVWELISGLIRAGVQICEADLFGFSVTNYFLMKARDIAENRPCRYSDWITLVMKILDDGAPFDLEKAVDQMEASVYYTSKTVAYFHGHSSFTMLPFLRAFEDVPLELGCGKLGRALLKKSLEEVKEILDYDSSAILDRNSLNQTALHLAADWSDGISFLLSRNGALFVNEVDWSDASPISYALRLGCTASVDLLIEASANVNREDLSCAINLGMSSIVINTVKALAETRERLRYMAITNLPQDMVISLEIPPDQVLDGEIYHKVLTALRSREVGDLRGFASRNRCSLGEDYIYHRSTCPNVGIADSLYVAEFRPEWSVDSFDAETWTIFLDKSLWLRKKGVHFDGDTVLCHDLAHNIPMPRRGHLENWIHDSGDHGKIFADKRGLEEAFLIIFSQAGWVKDDCLCSNHVCCSAVCILSRAYGYDIIEDHGCAREILKMAEAWMDPSRPDWEWIIPRVMRALVFELMGLTHSTRCCRNMRHDAEDIPEKQDEEWYLRGRFEGLVSGLLAEYDRMGVKFSGFLWNGLQKTYQSLLKEEESSEEGTWRIREIGVVLDE